MARMVQHLSITTMGDQTLREKLHDVIFSALGNMRSDVSNEERAAQAASAVLASGKFREFEAHDDWNGG